MPEQFLSKLKAYRRATHIPDEDLIPSLAGIFAKEASEWDEVKQEELYSWKSIETAFKRRFVGELHQDDIMEELRSRNQGNKEKIAQFISKFRRIMTYLKKPLPLREQLQLTFSHLTPEYQDYLWTKRLDSYEAIERYGRELERKEAIKDRYRSPPRRDKSRLPGTTYTGPHRSSHKVAAVRESSDGESSEPETKSRKEKKTKRKSK